MRLDNINTIYFLGIGGIGMSALARFFLHQGKRVYGYDLTPTEITSQLTAEGAHIHFDEDVSKIPQETDIAVYTPAVPKEHTEYQYFVNNNILLLKRSEVLGIICRDVPTIAIAGTHGKTTTTAMVAQMLMEKGEGRKEKGEGRKEKGEGRKEKGEGRKEDGGGRNSPSNFEGVDGEAGRGSLYQPKILSFIGGISKNLNSNFLCETGFDTVIVEADEFDRSFLTLNPQVAVITSMDADHLDVFKDHNHLLESFQLFANQIQPDGTLVIYDEIASQIAHPKKVTYGFSKDADYQISNIQYFPTKTTFDITYNLPHSSLLTPIPGRHNALNAVASLAAAIEYLSWKNDGIVDVELLQTSLAEFAGVKRRFDIRVHRNDFVYIDDYAHHPQEIKAFLEAVKKSFPTKSVTGIFQPHLYSRTRDFAQEFAHELEELDEIILLDIYPAREEPIPGITSNYLLSLIKNENKKLLTKEALVPYLQQNKSEVLLTMGAGDIDRLVGRLESIT